MSVRRRIAVAVILWLTLAAVVWNVVFDRVIVLAGRRYSYDATVLYRSTGHYLLIKDVMPAAVTRGVRLASAIAGTIAVGGLLLIALAVRIDAARRLRTGSKLERNSA
jgi:hypothetical protein